MSLEELKIIHEILDNSIDKVIIEDFPSQQNSKDLEQVKRFDILNLKISEFLTIHFTQDFYFKKNCLIRSVYSATGSNLVVGAIGIGKDTLLKQPRLGKYTVDKFEELLNQYSYSIEQPLSEEEKRKFMAYRLSKIFD